MFSLHPQLASDTYEIGDLSLSKVLLMDNAHLPWLILVPRRQDIREWHELNAADQLQLHRESLELGAALMHEFNGDKLNTGALGNLVPQLHLHHLVRFESDPVWPAPVWGNLAPKPYSESQASIRIAKMKTLIETLLSAF